MDGDKFEFAIDRGGTFTDIYARCPGGKIRVMKLLSVDPANYEDAPREGIRRILEQETDVKMDNVVDTSRIGWIRMGTTVATNALLERKGAKMALLINEGFKDLIFIGNQARPNIFDLEIVTPEVLYKKVVEVKCRVIPALTGRCQLDNKSWRRVKGSTGEDMFVTQELDEVQLVKDLEELRNLGIDSLAVVLAHSYTYVDHEIRVGELARKAGFAHVSLSHEVMPMIRIVPRGFTACADAYLTPHIKNYLQGFSSGFKDNLNGVNVLFMQSDGGLTSMNSFNGSRAILSGPAGGVVGYAITTYGKETDLPVIGFDMGGTSTDVSRYGGSYEHVYESTTAGVTIQAPQLDVNTVAAGGGSMLFFRSGLFVVGPESAGAHPGPACYKKGGPLAVTDANLMLGRLLPEYFPQIFGPSENEPLDKCCTLRAFEELTNEINKFLSNNGEDPTAERMTSEEVAMGFIRVANETMCRPICALTQAKGYDTSRHVLACFGGAGGQHACAIARSLGMSTVFIHKYAGILSAYGMALADVVEEVQEPSAEIYEQESFDRLDARLDAMEAKVKSKLRAQGFTDAQIETQPFLHLRYQGTDCALMCIPIRVDRNEGKYTRHGDFLASFLQRYQTEFGFTMPDRKILVNDVRVRGIGKTEILEDPVLPMSSEPPKHKKTTMVYFENGYQETMVYQLDSLCAGQNINGPAIIMDSLSTILVEPNCTAIITSRGDVKITIGQCPRTQISTDLDAIQLSIFSHRFMSIAEQMGRILQRTSISTNIKERLDFSCAVFGPDGGLVSNAPHIPVHLGAMQETVQYQIKAFKGNFEQGDVILSNHPSAGGSHLPDLTVITPVFYKNVEKPIFFVASRGHHADIGGITPGSMPPHSTMLFQEGAAFKSFLLVHKGIFREKELTDALMAPGKIPGSSGTRNLSDNLSDLKAQIAANQKGSQLVYDLIDTYTLEVVQAYMGHIQRNAEIAVREMLSSIGTKVLRQTGDTSVTAVDYLDDGSPIKLRLDFDINEGEATCDFSGSGHEVWGNCNAPRAITFSALIYCLRCIVGRDIPLNQGCLKPVKIIIPKGSLLDPAEEAAVVGGNVLTSQRIVDVVLRAFGACAASQGCMNNVTLGTEEWGYYETVAGGSGAGPTWDGRSGVHTHMTNTRITDLEILELRYPIVLNKFSLRPESGGNGAHRGGDGVVREMTFRVPMMLSVLTERRVNRPPGLDGGMPGERGRNTLMRADGRKINLGPKTAVPVYAGDKFILESPGGGGYGVPGTSAPPLRIRDSHNFAERGSVFEYRKAQESV
ncbi:5-oxoprolinase [Harpegnathos saltator]|uniref:5-oxoprolinase n=1 Tax=Harpegnathos saltator TaxID=610380 RepID=E2BGJ9_HARSA|nr:5-oxoprolinase [Harpegnathos saltator]XP_011138381.1 5-oxoprolinase [Harpegnathos saltator]XP_011138382.1 5-oxoprolinase [Harpegnathos saltator]EFN85192.1 5-oxoprolinase [Harpegnathos saltator]